MIKAQQLLVLSTIKNSLSTTGYFVEQKMSASLPLKID